MDVFSRAARSRIMAAVKSRNTTPELAVRSLVHRLGYRFRLHDARLPGSPDLVLPRHRAAIFVHGCFWHGHRCRRGRRVPQTNRAYWLQKRRRNQERDARAIRALRRRGWRVLVVWECWIAQDDLAERIAAFLEVPAPPNSRRRPSKE